MLCKCLPQSRSWLFGADVPPLMAVCATVLPHGMTLTDGSFSWFGQETGAAIPAQHVKELQVMLWGQVAHEVVAINVT